MGDTSATGGCPSLCARIAQHRLVRQGFPGISGQHDITQSFRGFSTSLVCTGCRNGKQPRAAAGRAARMEAARHHSGPGELAPFPRQCYNRYAQGAPDTGGLRDPYSLRMGQVFARLVLPAQRRKVAEPIPWSMIGVPGFCFSPVFRRAVIKWFTSGSVSGSQSISRSILQTML